MRTEAEVGVGFDASQISSSWVVSHGGYVLRTQTPFVLTLEHGVLKAIWFRVARIVK